ncbi:hypothetical protein D3C72_2383910 [compost metagenome]
MLNVFANSCDGIHPEIHHDQITTEECSHAVRHQRNHVVFGVRHLCTFHRLVSQTAYSIQLLAEFTEFNHLDIDQDTSSIVLCVSYHF